jgi:hypothetical protein
MEKGQKLAAFIGKLLLNNMYLQKNDFDINDFLQAVGFITPKGYNIQYFISPQGEGMEFSSDGPAIAQNNAKDESIVYKMTPPTLKQDYAQSPADYSIWQPAELGRKTPTPSILPRVTEPEELQSPFVKITESADPRKLEFILQEKIFPFEKGTFFSCKRKPLKEEKK